MRLIQFWSEQRELVLNAGASPEALEKLERSRGFVIPDELRSVYLFADGFDQIHGARGVNFWPSEQLERVSDYDGGAFDCPGANELVLFADYLSWSWGYAFRLGTAPDCGEIVMVGTSDGKPSVVATNFSVFVEEYLREGSVLYAP